MNYSTLYGTWLKERQDEALQPLHPLFYQQVAQYLSRLRAEIGAAEHETGKGNVLRQESENVERMIHELVAIRLDKMIRAGLQGDDLYEIEKLAMEERSVHQDLQSLFRSYRERIRLLMSSEQEVQRTHVAAPGFRLLKFVTSIPAIIGIDMGTYGPYDSGDVASIPSENAENLIRKGLAVEVEEESK